jgi:hypothetical protein
METKSFDFVLTDDKWQVFAKDSSFELGTIEWVRGKYDFLPNTNAKMMKITRDEALRNELIQFCAEKGKEREEHGGNK